MNNTTRTIRSEEITIDMRVLTIMEDGRKNGEIYLAAIAPNMELTVITLDEAPTSCPVSMKMMPVSTSLTAP